MPHGELSCAGTAQTILSEFGKDGRNWGKRHLHYVNTDSGQLMHCMLGALEHGMARINLICALAGGKLYHWAPEAERRLGETPALRVLAGIIRDQFPERVSESHVPVQYCDMIIIAQFNDHPDTVWADVELVLRKLEAHE